MTTRLVLNDYKPNWSPKSMWTRKVVRAIVFAQRWLSPIVPRPLAVLMVGRGIGATNKKPGMWLRAKMLRAAEFTNANKIRQYYLNPEGYHIVKNLLQVDPGPAIKASIEEDYLKKHGVEIEAKTIHAVLLLETPFDEVVPLLSRKMISLKEVQNALHVVIAGTNRPIHQQQKLLSSRNTLNKSVGKRPKPKYADIYHFPINSIPTAHFHGFGLAWSVNEPVKTDMWRIEVVLEPTMRPNFLFGFDNWWEFPEVISYSIKGPSDGQ